MFGDPFGTEEKLGFHCGGLGGNVLIFGGGDGGVDIGAKGDVLGFEEADECHIWTMAPRLLLYRRRLFFKLKTTFYEVRLSKHEGRARNRRPSYPVSGHCIGALVLLVGGVGWFVPQQGAIECEYYVFEVSSKSMYRVPVKYK